MRGDTDESAGAANDLNSFVGSWHCDRSAPDSPTSYRAITRLSKQLVTYRERHTPLTCQAGIESQRNEVPLPKWRHRKSAEQPMISIPFLETWHRLSLDVSMTLGVRDTYARNGRGHRDMPGEIEDQRDFKAQNAPCGATPTYRQERPMISIPCRNLAPQRSWDGLMTGRNLSPHSQGSWDGLSERVI